jgi:hypothetical protein
MTRVEKGLEYKNSSDGDLCVFIITDKTKASTGTDPRRREVGEGLSFLNEDLVGLEGHKLNETSCNHGPRAAAPPGSVYLHITFWFRVVVMGLYGLPALRLDTMLPLFGKPVCRSLN